MTTKITGRDFIFFFLGVLTIILIEVVWDWDNHVNSYKEGFNDSRKIDVVK